MFFEFEADFVEALRCIPMQVRLKLDTCGIKLKLNDWNHFDREERQALVALPCTTDSEIQAYREKLDRMVKKHTGNPASELPIDEHPAWMDARIIPDSVLEKVKELNVNLSLEQWATLTPLQRFALIKLCRSSHENSNFLPALKEFKLV